MKKTIGGLLLFIVSSAFFIITLNPYTYIGVVVGGGMAIYYFFKRF